MSSSPSPFIARIVTPIAAFLFAAAPALAQGGLPTADTFDAPYELLNLAETTTGILANRKSVLLDPAGFSGATAHDTLTAGSWETLYGQMRMSAASPNSFTSPAVIAAAAEAARNSGQIPLALLYTEFDYVDEDDFEGASPRLEVVTEQSVEKAYRPTADDATAAGYATPPAPASIDAAHTSPPGPTLLIPVRTRASEADSNVARTASLPTTPMRAGTARPADSGTPT